MFTSDASELTPEARRFLEPTSAAHRQYEALRAYFVEGQRSIDVAKRFGYTPASFRVLCHHFRHDPGKDLFQGSSGRPRKRASKGRRLRDRVIELRKRNLSVYDISRALGDGEGLSPVGVSLILKDAGFARLPRRPDEERVEAVRPEVAPVADVRSLDLSPRQFKTKFGGLFLFMRPLAHVPLSAMLREAGFPGSKAIPAEHAMRALLALKLMGTARHSHVMSDVFDEGLALFAGLNTIPKRSFLTEYSCRIDFAAYPVLMCSWFDAMKRLGHESGTSFDLDFHTIPFHGEDALVEKHYVSRRSRRQKGVLAFVAQDAETRVFCYGNTDLRKDDRVDEILCFVEFWRQRTGRVPEELVFDSQLTTYANLSRLNELGVRFMTLRRRDRALLAEIHRKPVSAWRRIELENIARAYRTPRVLDERVKLKGYDGELRQLTVADLGHEEPTLLLTNDLRHAPSTLVGRYAQRMVIENGIADGIDFFHMDALSSAVALKVNCDLQLTLMASSLYRLLGARIGKGYERARSRHLFRDFVDTAATITLSEKDVLVRLGKRAHNPMLLAADFGNTDVPIPWLGGRRLRMAIS